MFLSFSETGLAIVVCAYNTSPELLVDALSSNNAFALDVMTSQEWLHRKQIENVDLLWIRKDGTYTYARDRETKASITTLLMDCLSETNISR